MNDHPISSTSTPLWPHRVPILGVNVSALDMSQAVTLLMSCVQEQRKVFVTVTGVHGVVEAHKNGSFLEILNRSDLCVPDGMPLVKLSKWKQASWVPPEVTIGRVFGPDLMLALTAKLAEGSCTAFYYGGTPGTADELAANMEQLFPGIRTAGTFCPPFRPLSDEEKTEIAKNINSARPDIVWVGLSTPKQESWMAEFRQRLDAPILAGVGAAFDYNTGRLKRAPKWMQKSALEWLYRLIQEPRRLWKRYAVANSTFLWLLACETFKKRA